MVGEHLIDLDELILRCKDDHAKQYIAEAVACYRAGAFRTCIVATWIAVVFDIIHKLRQLDQGGDKEAHARLNDFEKIRQTHDIPEFLKFEENILSLAKDKFELLSPLEYDDLNRLHSDRHKCAHPSMLSLEETYQPAAELARSHLRNAVTHLLQHPPVQGKAALDYIWANIETPLFPSDTPTAVRYFQSSMLPKARPSLIRNLLISISKKLLLSEDDISAEEQTRFFAALCAILEMNREIGEKALCEKLPEIVRNIRVSEWDKVIIYLRNVPIAWDWLTYQWQAMTVRFIDLLDVQTDAFVLTDALHIQGLHDVAYKRLTEWSLETLQEQISRESRTEFAEECIRRFCDAKTYDAGNSALKLILSLVSILTPSHILCVLRAFVENDQLYDSRKTKQTITELFRLTERYASETEAEWLRVFDLFVTKKASGEESLANIHMPLLRLLTKRYYSTLQIKYPGRWEKWAEQVAKYDDEYDW